MGQSFNLEEGLISFFFFQMFHEFLFFYFLNETVICLGSLIIFLSMS